MSLMSAGSISLDSTFNKPQFLNRQGKPAEFSRLLQNQFRSQEQRLRHLLDWEKRICFFDRFF